jgi:MoaA/NifB/PqqE/SkfB family radical SAM enzyme
MQKTRRVKIVTGLKCNIQCLFCYYRDSLKAPNRSLSDIQKDLRFARRNGIAELDFSGGEPTMHQDLPAMIYDAKKLGFEKVAIISNGVRLSDDTYLGTLKSAGLDEILFSVHGPDAKIHDQLTTVPGSFTKISSALSNASAAGITIRVNTVVNQINVRSLPLIASFVADFHPRQVNFITINDWCFAKHLVDKLMLPYSDMSPHLKEACDLLEPRVPAVNVRYIPFCSMKGYERFVCNHRQVIYDQFEWVPYIRTRLEVQNSLLRSWAILAYGYLRGGAFKKTFRLPFNDLLNESITEALRHWFYSKGNQCRECSRNSICDGVENTYAKKFGLSELIPVNGELIKDAVYFRQ